MSQQLAIFDEKVFEANAIARAQWATDNVWIQRIAAVLINKINPSDKTFKASEISLQDIIGYRSGKANTLVRNLVDDLLCQRVILLHTDNEDVSGYNIFGGSVHYNHKRNTLKIGLNSELAPFYLELKKNFVAYGLAEFLSLPGNYHQSLYKYLKSWESEPSKTIDIAELHLVLNAAPSLRKNYGLFNKKALQPAHKFINDRTSLKYDYEPNKSGRKVVSVTFTFKSKAKFRKAPPISRSSKNEQ